MRQTEGNTTQIQAILDLAADGKTDAYDELIALVSERLLKLTRKMLRSYSSLRRWEQTDDVFQTAVIRLHQSLSEVKPDSVRGFFGLATLQIRRTPIDLARHHLGPEGHAAKHKTNAEGQASDGGDFENQQGEPDSLETLEMWSNFHSAVDALPENQREVFSLVWYGGTTQKQAAEVLQVSERTVMRRFYRARIKLNHVLGDEERI